MNLHEGKEWRTVARRDDTKPFVDPSEVLAYVDPTTEGTVPGEGPVSRGVTFHKQWRYPGEEEWHDA